MNTFLAILALVAFIAVYLLIQKGVNRASGAIQGAITGNTRKRGLGAVGKKLEFAIPKPGSDLIELLQSRLSLATAPNWKGELYVAGPSADGTELIIKAGTPMATAMTFVVSTEAAGEGCNGWATVAQWREVNGLIVSTDAIERLHKHVRAAVETLGGSLTESVSS